MTGKRCRRAAVVDDTSGCPVTYTELTGGNNYAARIVAASQVHSRAGPGSA